MKQTLHPWLQRFVANESGNILMITGATILVILSVAGAAVDLGRQEVVRMKLQQASDAAALAGSLAATGSDRESIALRYFNINYPATYLDVARPTPRVTVSGSNVSVSATVQTPSVFMKFVGLQNLTSTGSSEVLSDTTATAQKFDLVLVMDNSGSMAGAGGQDIGSGPYTAVPNNLRSTARSNFTTTCIATERAQGYSNSTATTNCNTVVNPWWTDDTIGISNKPFRLNALRYAAQTIVTSLLGASGSDNRIAAISWSVAVLNSTALTADASTLTQFLNTMFALGGTNSTLGLQKAQTLVSSFRTDAVRAVVFITDGMNTLAAQPGVDGNDKYGCNGSSLCTQANSQSLAVCSSLKSSNVLVYVIALGTDVTSGTQAAQASSFLKSCASTDAEGNVLFYNAPDANTLTAVFSTILTSIKKVRVTK